MHSPPLVPYGTTFPPHSVVGLWMLSYEVMSLQESIERPILPLHRGKSGRSRIRGEPRSG